MSLKAAAILVVAVAFTMPPCAYADSLIQAEKSDVEMLLDAATGRNSAYWASYIGETKGRVYIEYASMIHTGSSLGSKGPKYTVYWLPPSALSEEQLNQLKESKQKRESSR